MGIYSRDYIREARPSHGFDGDLWAIKFILIANIAVFVLQIVSPRIEDWLELSREGLLDHFQIWSLVTYGFCHSRHEILHIVFNMYVLWMFGNHLEPIYGSREFLAFYIAGVIVSGLVHIAITTAGVVGASGGVMAVVFLTAMQFPRMTVRVMFVLPLELRWLAVLVAVADLMGAFNPGSLTAHAAHLGGAAFGVLYYRYHWHITGLIDRLRGGKFLKMPTRRPHVRVYQPPPEDDMEDEVDAILQKISEHGEASLTDRERKILSEASRKYRERR